MLSDLWKKLLIYVELGSIWMPKPDFEIILELFSYFEVEDTISNIPREWIQQPAGDHVVALVPWL